MRGGTIDFEIVRKIGLALPCVEESTAYGSPALKLGGKLLACVPANRPAEPASLRVCLDFDDRAEVLAAAPDVCYLTDPYGDYEGVLVRLSLVVWSRSVAELARYGLQICDPKADTPSGVSKQQRRKPRK